MGTRGNVIIKESDNGKILVNMYHHMDSYPSGLGLQLSEFLKDRIIVNGISLSESRKISNGIMDLAAQIVTLLKGSPENSGGVYIQRPETVLSILKDPNDYTYIIYPVNETKIGVGYNNKPFKYKKETTGIIIIVYNWKNKIFTGTADEFDIWINESIINEKAEIAVQKLINDIPY